MNPLARLQHQWDIEAARSAEPMPCPRPTAARMAGAIAALLLLFLVAAIAIAALPHAGAFR
jgi:hypothetical protein